MFTSMMSPRAGRGAGHACWRPMVEQLEERLCLAASPMTVVEQHLHEILNWVLRQPVRGRSALQDGPESGPPSRHDYDHRQAAACA